MDQTRQRQQRRNQANRINQRTQYGAQRNFDQEVGSLGRTNEYLNDLNTDYEIGGLAGDLDAGLNADFEVGDMGQNYEFPVDGQRQQKPQAQRTQRRKKNDR